jgi:CRISPR-associated protein Cas6
MTVQPVDFVFPVKGTVATDSGYLWFAGLSVVAPSLHDDMDWILGPITGKRTGARREGTTLTIRGPLSPKFLALSGCEIQVGDATVVLSDPSVRLLVPHAKLMSRFVTTNAETPAQQREEIARQIYLLAPRCLVKFGHTDSILVKGNHIWGSAVEVSGLSSEESLAIQACGVGGRRHMGGGYFSQGERPGFPLRGA